MAVVAEPDPIGGGTPLRIAAVVDQTGVSKELIHHYLREGLLPRSEDRARYGARQVRLLRQIRTLREDHHLPLDLIRRLFEVFGFEPARIEAVTLSESLGSRVARFVCDGRLLSPDELTAAELCERTGVEPARLEAYVQAGIVAPAGDRAGDRARDRAGNGAGNGAADGTGVARFSGYDANVVALCEHGVELGIPFDSFRTIASHIRLGFDLEYAEFYGVEREPGPGAPELLADLFVRREVASAFVASVLAALTQRRASEVLAHAARRGAALDDVVYRPSAVFVRRHGLDRAIDAARQRVRDRPDDRNAWRHAADLLVHAGRYPEADFFLEEALQRWPDDDGLRQAWAWVLLLTGDTDCAGAEIGRSGGDAPPGSRPAVLRALCQFQHATGQDRPEAVIEDIVAIVAGLDGVEDNRDPSTRMLAGWLLTALPQALGCQPRGRALLEGVVPAAQDDPAADGDLPGLADRLRINATWLLFDALRRDPGSSGNAQTTPNPEALAQRVCRLDPGSTFAEAAYLATDAIPAIPRGTP